MKISVVTVVFNGEDHIADCINSVLNQDYPNIEHVIIDGGSTDNTIAIVKSYGDKIHTFVSEKDEGIYYAMNKGISLATGDVIAILNSDDEYADSAVLRNVAELFLRHDVDAVQGNGVMVRRDNMKKIVRSWRDKPMYPRYFDDGRVPNHLALFVKKKAYERVGFFNTSYRIAADYEFMLRLFKVHQASSVLLERVLVIQRLGGVSNRSLRNIVAGNREIVRAWRENNLGFPLLCMMLYRPLHKIRQFFVYA